MKMLPWWVKLLVLGGLVLLAAAALMHYKSLYDEARREEGRVEVREQWRAAVQESDREQRRLEQQRQRRQQEADDVQAQALARARADAAAARRAGDGLRSELERFLAAGRNTCANRPAAGERPSVQGADPLDLLADLFSRADREAGELAEYADQLRAAGAACEARHDALTDVQLSPPVPSPADASGGAP